MDTVDDFIFELQAYEVYAFTTEELVQHLPKSEEAIRSKLKRLVKEKKIMNLRQDFYLVLPPRFVKYGTIPLELYVDQLCKWLGRKYYISLLTAAKYHGAAHQQVMLNYVTVELPSLLNIRKGKARIDFINASVWPEKNITKFRSKVGDINVSDPVLTAVDLISNASKMGGINHILANIEELAEEFKEQMIKDLLQWYPKKAVLQRLGFLLEEVDASSRFTDIIFNYLSQHKTYPILLQPDRKMKAGAVKNRWKIHVNLNIESDL